MKEGMDKADLKTATGKGESPGVGIRAVKVLTRSCIALAIIVAALAIVELAVSPCHAIVVSESSSAAGLSAGCPCSGACGTPTATPAPVQQSIDGGSAGQPPLAPTPEPAAAPSATQEAGTAGEASYMAVQPATAAPVDRGTGGESIHLGFPSLLSDNSGSARGFSTGNLMSFTMPWQINEEASGQMPGHSQGLKLGSLFQSPKLRFSR